MFNVTSVRVSLVPKAYAGGNGRLLAGVVVVLDDCFAVHGIKIIAGDHGLFVSFPSIKCRDGVFNNIAHPLTKECRNHMEEVIFKAYREECERIKSHESQ